MASQRVQASSANFERRPTRRSNIIDTNRVEFGYKWPGRRRKSVFSSSFFLFLYLLLLPFYLSLLSFWKKNSRHRSSARPEANRQKQTLHDSFLASSSRAGFPFPTFSLMFRYLSFLSLPSSFILLLLLHTQTHTTKHDNNKKKRNRKKRTKMCPCRNALRVARNSKKYLFPTRQTLSTVEIKKNQSGAGDLEVESKYGLLFFLSLSFYFKEKNYCVPMQFHLWRFKLVKKKDGLWFRDGELAKINKLPGHTHTGLGKRLNLDSR